MASSSAASALLANPLASRSSRPSPWSHASSPAPAEQSDREKSDADVFAPSDDDRTTPDAHYQVENGGAVADEASRAGDRGKKPAWTSRPTNGSAEMGLVMGAAWPALSESSKGSFKGSPSAVSDLSVSPSSQTPAASANVSSPKPNSVNSAAAPNHGQPARQKSMRRGGANGGGSGNAGNSSGVASGSGVQQVGVAAVSPSPPVSSGVLPDSTQDHQAVPQSSPQSRNSGNWDRGSRGGGLGSQFHGNSDHHRGRGGNRRGNNSGSGPHHNNYGNNRDQDRGNYDSFHRRGYQGREAHMQQWGSQSYIRPPQNAQIPSPFINHVPMVRPFGNTMLYTDVPSVIYVAPQQPAESFAGLPFITYPPPAFFVPHIDPQRSNLLKQIEYYFSNENLCKDTYLRQQMDEHGWVLASVIAGFNRVKALTDNISYILETVWSSNLVEVQGEKMRRRNDWMNWVLPPSNNSNAPVPGQQIVSTQDLTNLSDSFRTFGLGTTGIENTTGISAHREIGFSRSASGNISRQFRVVNDLDRDGIGQVAGHVNSDGSHMIRSLSRNDTL